MSGSPRSCDNSMSPLQSNESMNISRVVSFAAAPRNTRNTAIYVAAPSAVIPNLPVVRPSPKKTQTKRCAVMDDKMVRDGLIHAMASKRDNTAPSSGSCCPSLTLLLVGREATEELGDEYKQGQALECALFSSIAIGGLMLGCPVRDVSRHLVSAQRCREQLAGLKDRTAVSALLLHATSHAFLGGAQVSM